MKDNYVVIGLGRFGSQTAVQLFENGATVFAIDVNPAKTEEVADKVSRAITADATNRDVLLQFGVDKCDCAIVAMARDLAASVLITVNLKAMGVKKIICKAQNERDKEVLETLGATSVIIPEFVAAEKLSRKLMCRNIIEDIELFDGYSMVELHAPRSWWGKNLRETNARAKYGINVIAVKNEKSVIVSPGAEELIGKDSTLIVMGDEKSLDGLEKL